MQAATEDAAEDAASLMRTDHDGCFPGPIFLMAIFALAAADTNGKELVIGPCQTLF